MNNMSSSNVMITPDILLDDGKVMRNVLLFNKDIKEWDPMVAYLDGDYYYLFKGKVPETGKINEPGIYIAGQFGIRIEDTVLITKGGCEALTKSNKEHVVI